MYRNILFMFFAWAVAAAGHAQQVIAVDLSVPEFNRKLATATGKVVLDLRTAKEVKTGVIPGAFQMDYYADDFEKKLADLDRDKPYFIYCAAGGRSGKVRRLMSDLGFREVYNLADGIAAWKEAKMPLIAYKRR